MGKPPIFYNFLPTYIMLVSSATYQVHNNITTANKRLRLRHLSGLMQETAYLNLAEVGVDFEMMADIGMAWVMLKFKIEVARLPRHRETFSIETYPAGNERCFFYRDFKVLATSGEVLATATSSWILIDSETRKLRAVPDFITPLAECPVAVPLKRGFEKLVAPKEGSTFTDIKVTWHDIDVNQHVNNAVYLNWLTESMPLSVLQQKQICALSINYRNECTLGETVRVSTKAVSDETFIHAINNIETGKELVLAKTFWQ